VFVQAGSRNEDLETTGTAYLLQKMFERGTNTRNKTQIAQDIGSAGAIYKAETGREVSSFTMKVFKNDVNKGVKILGDMISNSILNASELELVKEEVS
jgi:processing peptidase subunit beta